MSDNRRIAKNTALLYVRMFLIMAVTLYISRIVLNTLGVQDFGIYNVVGGIVTMFTFLNGAMSAATSRFLTFELGCNNFKQLGKVFSTSLVSHILIAFVIFILAETVGLWFLITKLVIPPERMLAAHWVYQFSVLTCMLSLTQVPYNATIIAHERMGIYAYISILEVILRLLTVYLLVLLSKADKLILYAILMFIVQVIIVIVYRLYCLRNYDECRFKFQKDKSLYRTMFSYSGWDLIGNISVLAQGQGLNLLLNIFFGPVVNAARAIAYQVQGAITQFSNNFMTAVRPQIIKLYAEGKTKEMMTLVYNSSRFSFYLILFITLPICMELDCILILWLKDYPEYTITFTQLVLINNLILAVKNPRIAVFHATGNIKLTNIFTGLTLCSVFPVAYFFLKGGLSPDSVFIAMIGTNLISELVSCTILKRYIRYSMKEYFLKIHGKCLLVAGIASIIPFYLHLLMEPGFIRFFLSGIVSTLSVAVTVYYIGIDHNMRYKVILKIKDKWKHVRSVME